MPFARITTLALASVLALSAFFPAHSWAAPSFDCAKAKQASEQAVCEEAELAELDNAMAAAYRAYMQLLPPDRTAAAAKEQRAWLASRNASYEQWRKKDSFETKLRAKKCLADLYRERTAELETGITKIREQDDVYDVIAKWHFKEINRTYSNGDEFLLCVKMQDGGYGFWNPREDKIVSRTDELCRNSPKGFNILLTNIPDKMSWEKRKDFPLAPFFSSFSGAEGIYTENNLLYSGRRYATKAPSKTLSYYSQLHVVTYGNGAEKKFYVIQWLGRKYTSQYCSLEDFGNCDDDFEITQEYQTADVSDALDLGGGRSLLYGVSVLSMLKEPTLLIVKNLPTAVWSSRNHIFIIPEPVIAAELEEAGDDLALRTKAVLRALGKLPTRSHACEDEWFD